jgi:phosphoglycerate dehydrogenase-like enzyme
LTRKLVVDLRSRSAAFRLPDAIGNAIVAATPAGWRTHLVQAETDSFGDGAQNPSEESVREIADAEVFLSYGMPKRLFSAANELRWVHTATSGVASLLFPGMMASDVMLTNSAGIYGPPIAEHVLGGVLQLLRAFDVAGELQRKKTWNSSVFATTATRVRELSECRTLIVGVGGIGGETARRFSMLGSRCVGVRRDVAKGIPDGFERVIGLDTIDAELCATDILVLAAPLTTDTRAVVTAERLALMPAGAIVVNVARGPLVDEAALVASLTSGHLRGAVLDVFATEPLAPDSPLWHLPNVVLTPHVAGVSPRRFFERLSELFLDNWARYRAGQPLRNLVDKEAGY